MERDAFARKFPDPSWAWPTGNLDTLLIAAGAPNRDRAIAAARDWFELNNIDDASFSENRLLLAISSRFGKDLSDLSEYPRLVGLQRMLWTKSRMAIREALPAFREMSTQGIRPMLIKGAARIALYPGDQKSRVSHDIDILVARHHAANALNVLSRFGWTASTGESDLCLHAGLSEQRSVNLFYGHFGDIDIHMQGFGSPVYDSELENELLMTARETEFFGQPVLVPSPEYWLAVTLDSSVLDAHSHSDWLVDCAALLSRDAINDALLISLLKRRGLTFQAEIAFSYLRHCLGCEISALEVISAYNASLSRRTRYPLLLQSKPRCDWTPRLQAARGIAKQLHLLRARREKKALHGGASRMLRGKIHRLRRDEVPEQIQSMSAALSPDKIGKGKFELTLAVNLNGMRRRYDFEINSDQGHVSRLRARNVLGRSGVYKMVFRGKLTWDTPPDTIWIEARPGKIVRSHDAIELAHYGAQGFVLLNAKMRSSD